MMISLTVHHRPHAKWTKHDDIAHCLPQTTCKVDKAWWYRSLFTTDHMQSGQSMMISLTVYHRPHAQWTKQACNGPKHRHSQTAGHPCCHFTCRGTFFNNAVMRRGWGVGVKCFSAVAVTGLVGLLVALTSDIKTYFSFGNSSEMQGVVNKAIDCNPPAYVNHNNHTWYCWHFRITCCLVNTQVQQSVLYIIQYFFQ